MRMNQRCLALGLWLLAAAVWGCGSNVTGQGGESDALSPSPIAGSDAVAAGEPGGADGAEEDGSPDSGQPDAVWTDAAATEDASADGVGPDGRQMFDSSDPDGNPSADSGGADAMEPPDSGPFDDASPFDASPFDASPFDTAAPDATDSGGSDGIGLDAATDSDEGDGQGDVADPLLPEGSACEEDWECANQLCVPGPDGPQCAQFCSDGGCPDGWWCGAHPFSLAPGLCIWPELDFCSPCSSALPCVAGTCVPGEVEDLCVLPCSPTGQCPTGFTCSTTGDSAGFCLPAGGDCECALAALEDPDPESCELSNEWGTCEGVWVCAPGGELCSAAEAAPETCNGADDNCDGVIDPPDAEGCELWYADQDEDGAGDPNDFACLCAPIGVYTAAQGDDCDDTDELVHPGADEVCNSIDDNCDGASDPVDTPGCTTWFADADGDNFGAESACLCEPTALYNATVGGDCDDEAPQVNPSAEEVCNNVDDNCDGTLDPENSPGCVAWYADADGDGYGAGQACLCAPTPVYHATVGGDCDDQDRTIHPNAEEICNNTDDDCDGVLDPAGSPGCLLWYADADGDDYGLDSMSECLCAPTPVYSTLAAGDCDDEDSAVHPGATTTCGDGVCANTMPNCVDGVIQACVPLSGGPETCNAPPASCGRTTTGVDGCGQPCSKVGPSTCYTVHPACLNSGPGQPTNSPTCVTPKGKYDCDLTACPGGGTECGAAGCGPWPNTIGADCEHCEKLSCVKTGGKDQAQFKCKNIAVPPTP